MLNATVRSATTHSFVLAIEAATIRLPKNLKTFLSLLT
jgi:hypothetical protein